MVLWVLFLCCYQIVKAEKRKEQQIMKATIVLIADNDAENYGRKLMLEAHRYGKMGFEMARLPQHVSLKQPFAIPGLENMEVFFDGFGKY